MARYYDNAEAIEEEIERLVEMFEEMEFEYSSDVSNYIRTHDLRDEFPNITGYLKMSLGSDTWEFDGGIDPCYYAEICRRLGLDNNGSHAQVEGFESYAYRSTYRYGRNYRRSAKDFTNYAYSSNHRYGRNYSRSYR